MRATFHERQYELAVNLELIGGSGNFFAPTQQVEEGLGYDIALVPGEAAIWSALGLPVPPTGVETPIAYDASGQPISGGQTFAASLFIQYKRPEHMIRRSARETRPRQARGGSVPFFRVRLNADQHDVLIDLERRVGADAVVRYGAPLFHEIEDLWVRQATRGVFSASSFIPPSRAGNPPACWTYDEQGTSIFCSEPRFEEAERRDDVLRAIVQVARERESERTSHLRALASEVGEIDLTPRHRRRRIDDTYREARDSEDRHLEWVRPPLPRAEWLDRLQEVFVERPEEAIGQAVDAAVVANAAASIGLTWFLAEVRARSEPTR